MYGRSHSDEMKALKKACRKANRPAIRLPALRTPDNPRGEGTRLIKGHAAIQAEIARDNAKIEEYRKREPNSIWRQCENMRGQELKDFLDRHARRQENHRKYTASKRNRERLFELERPGMTAMYLLWAADIGDRVIPSAFALPVETEVEGSIDEVIIVDISGSRLGSVLLMKECGTMAACCIRQGYLPCSTQHINAVVTLRILEVCRQMTLERPKLRAHVFYRMLCDRTDHPHQSYRAKQFKLAFDSYMAIRAHAEGQGHVLPSHSLWTKTSENDKESIQSWFTNRMDALPLHSNNTT
ncbi:hypothetical protein MIND_01086500 [Mycena indigotica]|uniref:Uncharacterized protein n=1 Tax=Mycena indigotica TaxID=2126181 RepID=A0A8H6SBV1_9AGAR|nr:uncharacterized protein MIND_01086500 [Mycena indigotica]KAF7295467.1 hypothetical protein MIND_01086500 [Mycena indigotica]